MKLRVRLKVGNLKKGEDHFGLGLILERGGRGSFCSGNVLQKFNTNAKM
jgi:hypothetical protein